MASAASIHIDGEVAHPFQAPGRDGPVADLLARARPAEGADHGVVWSADGVFRMSIPLERLRQATLVGGRLDVPDAPSRQWQVKDVSRIEVTTGPRPDSWDPDMNC